MPLNTKHNKGQNQMIIDCPISDQQAGLDLRGWLAQCERERCTPIVNIPELRSLLEAK